MDIVSFQNDVKDWGRVNFRPFTWRLTSDPYRILMAELMLHRTQAAQVIDTYNEFISLYPDINTLAKAEATKLELRLHSLGLSWRTKLIRLLANEIESRYNGIIPSDKKELQSLPGVSDYIASALRCFAWNLPDALVDTNTVRIVGRLYNIDMKESSRRTKKFRNLIAQHIDLTEPRVYNYAMLDLANLVCTKRVIPKHNLCPVIRYCIYGQTYLDKNNHT